MNILARRSLLTTVGAISALTSVAALASDVVSLRHGTYVQADTACADGSNATMRTFTGRGFDSANAAECVARPLSGKRGDFAQTCTDYRQPTGAPKTRSTQTLKLRVLSRTSYVVDGTKFRFCPSAR